MNSKKRPHTRKDPLKREPLPHAGDSTYERIVDVVMGKPLLWLIAAGVFATVAMAQWVAWLAHRPLHPGPATTCALVAGAVAFVKMRSCLREVDQLRLGMRGERAVGHLLDELRAKGYRVFHDVEGNGFNIDHLLIGPAGVFVIETKTVRKRDRSGSSIKYDGQRVLIDGFEPDRDPIRQARACRDHVCDILTRVIGHRPKMRAVVLYPGWYVERQPKGVEVWVLNPEALPSFLDHEPVVLSADEVRRYAAIINDHLQAKSER